LMKELQALCLDVELIETDKRGVQSDQMS
jgi:hypothetical protein